MMSGMWPHFDAVAKKCEKVYSDNKSGQDISKYTTNGQEDKRVDMRKTKRFESPNKGGSPDVTMGGAGSTGMKPQNSPRQSTLPAAA